MDLIKEYNYIITLNNNSLLSEKDRVKKFLDEATSRYENDGTSVLSDYQWDAVQKRYSKVVEPYKFGSKLNSGSLADTEHFMIDVSGIDNKINNEEELSEFLSKIKTPISYISYSQKFDGMSIMLKIDKEGLIVDAVTRGRDGKGVSLKKLFLNQHIDLYLLNNQPTNLDLNLTDCNVRCEIIMTNDSFEAYKLFAGQDYKDKRSCVAGLIKKANVSGIDEELHKFVRLAPFTIERNGISDPFYSSYYLDEVIDEKGIYDSFMEPMDYINNCRSEAVITRSDLKYDIDGLVFILYDIDKKVIDKFAYKFESFSIETTLLDVEYDFSPKSGIYTPMGCIDVTFQGREFSRVSLANVGRLIREDFAIGSKVLFTYRGDVMGYLTMVESNIKQVPLNVPKNCIHCNSLLNQRKDDKGEITFLVCENDSCDGKKYGKILNHVQKLDLKGIELSTIEVLVDELNITTLEELYSLTKEDLINLPSFKDKKIENVIATINSRDTITDAEILGSLNITGIGLTTSELVLKNIDLIDLLDRCLYEDTTPLIEELNSIKGIENTTSKRIVSGVRDNVQDLIYLVFTKYANYVRVIDTIKKSKLEGVKTFVVTGDVSIFSNRKELEKHICSFNHKIVGSVSNKTDYLINNDIDSNSSKNKKAKELNIPIISEQELLDLL